MHTWVDIATLTKKRNAQGRFVARCQANLLLCLKPGLEVAIVPPVLDAPRFARIMDVTRINGTTADITFEFHGGPWESSQEEEIVGCHFLVKRDQLDESVLAVEECALRGFEVIDLTVGRIGIVSDELHNPGQSLLVVTKEPDGDESLIPFVDEIVKEIDHDTKQVRVDLPIGLLDL